ncbi:hypothetical protein HGRIS_012609 [Hohenbuehelia grisea]|uniref:AAA+ ATPase domain-containing protein n=1 Tax=Hohenbuehelia grisea TaxID=104357 RepID=A0ABR3ISZ1_9AGAR
MGFLVVKRRPPPSGAKIFYGERKPRKANLPSTSEISSELPAATGDDPAGSRSSVSSTLNEPASSRPSTSSTLASGQSAGGGKDSRTLPLALASSITVLSLLKEVCEVFDQVPYVSVAAGIALQIANMAEDVRRNEDRSRELIDKVATYSRVVFGALKDSQIRSGVQLEGLREDLLEITTVLQAIKDILSSLAGKKTTDRLNRFINRGEIFASIEEQDRRLNTAVTAFQLKSAIVLRTASSAPPSPLQLALVQRAVPHQRFVSKKLPSKPQIMFGRHQEVEQIVSTILDRAPARIAILGPGGIGKTSTALSVLHDHRIYEKFSDGRLFVSCEGAASVDLMLNEIAVSMQIDTGGLVNQLYGKIIQKLGEAPSILVLDNFETPWHNPDIRKQVEVLLEDITALDTVAVIVTLRGSEHPAGVRWSQPLLPSLRPVDWHAAVTIFKAISNKMDDYAEKLIRAVDCVPLAVSLLGYLAAVDGETPEALWKRWNVEQTSMIERGDGDRLTNLEYSIQLSLFNPRMKRDPAALALLGLMSLLPDGVCGETYSAMTNMFPDSSNLQKSLATLRQNALIFKESHSDSIRILNPIRLFVLSHHPPSRENRIRLQEHYIDLVLDADRCSSLARAELGNAEAMLVDALRRDDLDRTVDAVVAFSQHSYSLGIMSTSVIARAEERLADGLAVGSVSPPPHSAPAKPRALPSSRVPKWHFWRRKFAPGSPEREATGIADPYLKKRGDCLGCWGQMLGRQGQLQLAEAKLKQALSLHERAGDISGRAYDYHNLGCLMSRQPASLDDAESMFQLAIQLHEQIGDSVGKVYDLMGLGHVLLQRSRNTEALAIFEQALAYHVEDGDLTGQATALHALGHALLARSMCDLAEERFRRALDLHTKDGDTAGQAAALSGIACTFLLRSNYTEAKLAIDASLALQTAPGDPNDLHILGRVYILGSYLSEAEATLTKALDLHTQLDDELGVADDCHYLARTHFQQGRVPDAVTLLAKAQLTYAKSDRSVGTADSFTCAAMIDLRHDQLEAARANVQEAIILYKELDCDIGLAYAYNLLGCIGSCEARKIRNPKKRRPIYEAAVLALNNALEIHCRIKNIQGEANDYLAHAEILMHQSYSNGHNGQYLVKSSNDEALAAEVTRQKGYSDALLTVSRALELHLQIGDRAGQADDLTLQAYIFCVQSRLEDAKRVARQASELHLTTGQQYGVAHASFVAALIASREYDKGDIGSDECWTFVSTASDLLIRVEAMDGQYDWVLGDR